MNFEDIRVGSRIVCIKRFCIDPDGMFSYEIGSILEVSMLYPNNGYYPISVFFIEGSNFYDGVKIDNDTTGINLLNKDELDNFMLYSVWIALERERQIDSVINDVCIK